MRTLPLLLCAALLVAAGPPSARGETREFEIQIHELQSGGFHVLPEQYNARVGDTLKVTVHNQGRSNHTMVFCGDADTVTSPSVRCEDAWARSGAIPPGEKKVVTVPVKQAGTFLYYCDVPGHKQGMQGTLVVQEADSTQKETPGAALAGVLAALALAAVMLRRR